MNYNLNILTIVLLVFMLLRSGRMNNLANGSDFPMMSLFVSSLACMSFTSNVPTGFNSRSLQKLNNSETKTCHQISRLVFTGTQTYNFSMSKNQS